MKPSLRHLVAWAIGVALVGAAPRDAGAVDLYSFFDSACRRRTGILVHVDGERVALVDLDGRYALQPRADVASVAIHTTLENPLAQIDVGGGLGEHLRRVWVGDDRSPTFTGWTTAFFDDLLLYFDLEGKVHVLDPEEIRKLGDPGAVGVVRPRTAARIDLAFPAELVPCGTKTVAPSAVLPSRVIADRIKVGDYLTHLEERYRNQAGLEERTKVYAAPFLFDEQSRVGLLYDAESTIPLPLYFRWSNGRPYRFQSLNVIGNSAHEWLPFAFPTVSARSDIKSHFFSGTFIGHLLSLPAGTNGFSFQEVDELLQVGAAPRIEHSYNYLLLMGADLWRLSLGAGTSYLSSRIQVAPRSAEGSYPPIRTVLAAGFSPTVRLRYQGDGLDLRALYYRTRQRGTAYDVLEVGEPPDDMAEDAHRYAYRLDTVRLGATWRLLPTIQLSVDQIATRGGYRDNLPMEAIDIRLLELTTAGELAVTFGRYVTVRGTARLNVRRHDVKVGAPGRFDHVDPRFGGALEFVF